MKEVLQFLKDNPTFFLATVDQDRPRVRPFGAVAEWKGKLYLITSNQKKVWEQIKQNPNIELCGMNPKGEWLRVEAAAVCDSSREAKEHMLQENPNLTSLYSADDGIMEVFFLQNATATFYSFTSEPRVIHF